MIASCGRCAWTEKVPSQALGGQAHTAHWVAKHMGVEEVAEVQPEPEKTWVPAKRNTRPIRRAK